MQLLQPPGERSDLSRSGIRELPKRRHRCSAQVSRQLLAPCPSTRKQQSGEDKTAAAMLLGYPLSVRTNDEKRYFWLRPDTTTSRRPTTISNRHTKHGLQTRGKRSQARSCFRSCLGRSSHLANCSMRIAADSLAKTQCRTILFHHYFS